MAILRGLAGKRHCCSCTLALLWLCAGGAVLAVGRGELEGRSRRLSAAGQRRLQLLLRTQAAASVSGEHLREQQRAAARGRGLRRRRRLDEHGEPGLSAFTCPQDGNLPGNNIRLTGGATFVTVSSAEQCALICNIRTDCLSFDYQTVDTSTSSAGRRCYLGNGVTELNTPLTQGTGYSYYEKAAPGEGCRYGCTDPTAANFDSAAEAEPQGADVCAAPVLGCRNPSALNYNPYANQASPRCVFTELQHYFACPVPVSPPGGSDGGSGGAVVAELTGRGVDECADECLGRPSCSSFTYHGNSSRCYLLDFLPSNAVQANRSSMFVNYARVPGVSELEPWMFAGCVLGCLEDPTASNYNPGADRDNGLCNIEWDCNDPQAVNFDENARTRGACEYTWLFSFACPVGGTLRDASSTLEVEASLSTTVANVDECAQLCLENDNCVSFDVSGTIPEWHEKSPVLFAVGAAPVRITDATVIFSGSNIPGLQSPLEEGVDLRLRLVDADSRRTCASAGVELNVTSVETDEITRQTTIGFNVDGAFELVGATATCTESDTTATCFNATGGCPTECVYTYGPCNVILIEDRECLLYDIRAGPGQLHRPTEFVHYELVGAVARPCVYGCIDPSAANYARSPGASCTETATASSSVVEDATRCADVTELDTDVACASIMGSELPDTSVCTYSPGALQLGVCEAKRVGCTDANAANYNAGANWPDQDTCVYTALAHRFSCPRPGAMLPDCDYLDLGNEQDNPQLVGDVETCADLCEQNEDCLRFEFESLRGGGGNCFLGGGQTNGFGTECALLAESPCSESLPGTCADVVEEEECNSRGGCLYNRTACVSRCHTYDDWKECEGTGSCTFTLHFYFEKIADETATGCIYGCIDPAATNFKSIAVVDRASCDPVSPDDCESCAYPSGCEHEGTCDALVRFKCPKEGQLAGHDIDFGAGVSFIEGLASAEECATYCLANAGCVSFDYSLELARCHLGNAVEAPDRRVEPGTELGTALTAACLACAGQFTDYLYYELAEPDRSVVLDSADLMRGCAYGCTNSSSVNFDVRREHNAAIQMIDDGSCIPKLEGCNDPRAANFNEATVPVEKPVGMCGKLERQDVECPLGTQPPCYKFIVGGVSSSGTTCALSESADGCVQGGGDCIYTSEFIYETCKPSQDSTRADECADIVDQAQCNSHESCVYTRTDVKEYTDTGDGSCWYVMIEGCMNRNALNFRPDATYAPPGVCIFPGCTNSNAFNFNRNANQDDGTCITDVLSQFACPEEGVPMDSPRANCILAQATVDFCGSIQAADECENHANCTYASSSFYCNTASTANDCLSQSEHGVDACTAQNGCTFVGENQPGGTIESCSRQCLGTLGCSGFGFRPDDRGSIQPACTAKPLRISGVDVELHQITLATVDASIAAGACVPIDSENCCHQAQCSDKSATACESEPGVCRFTAPQTFRFADAPGASCALNGAELSIVDVHHCTGTGESGVDCSTVEGIECPDGCTGNATVVTFPAGEIADASADSCVLMAVATEALCSAAIIRSGNATEDKASCEATGNGDRCEYVAPMGQCSLFAALAPTDAFNETASTIYYARAASDPSTQACEYGCNRRDKAFVNFDPDARVNDGSCIDVVFGCTDLLSAFYNESATVSNGQCGQCADSNALNFVSNSSGYSKSCAYSAIELFTCPQPGRMPLSSVLYVGVRDHHPNVTTASRCAELCFRNAWCISFDYSPSNKQCRTGTFAASWSGSPGSWSPSDATWGGIKLEHARATGLQVDSSDVEYWYYERIDYVGECPTGLGRMDIWVDVEQGDDSNSGGTHQTALMTVREAVRRAYETPRPRVDTECPVGAGIYATTVMLHVIDEQGAREERLKLWDPVGCTHGCTDPEKLNYNARARTDVLNLDAVAACIDKRTGCMQPGMKNYDEHANVNGFCESYMFGCTDPDADNYDQDAENDDGSCVTRPLDLFSCPVPLEVDPLPTMVVERYNISGTCALDNVAATECGAIEDETACNEHDSCRYNPFANYCGIDSTTNRCSSFGVGSQCNASVGCTVAVEGSSVMSECARECLQRSLDSEATCTAKPLRISSVDVELHQITLATVDASIAAGACVPIDSENCCHQAQCSDKSATACESEPGVCRFTAPQTFRFADAPGASCALNGAELSIVDVHHCTGTGESGVDCSTVEGIECPDGCTGNATVVTFPAGEIADASADSCVLMAVATEALCSAAIIRSGNATEDKASCEATGNGDHCVYRSTRCTWFMANSAECYLPYVGGDSHQPPAFQATEELFQKFDMSEWRVVAGLSNQAPFRGERCAFGCTDSRATPASYAAEAQVDDGTCEYPPLPESWRSGCRVKAAMNYDSRATIDCSGCCILERLGCMTETSPSFDPEANTVCVGTAADAEQVCELDASGCPDGCNQTVCVAQRLGCPRVNQSLEFARETLRFAGVLLDPPPELAEVGDCVDSDDYLSMFACAQLGVKADWEETPDWDETMTEPNECAQRCINYFEEAQHCVSFSFAKINLGTNQSLGHCLLHIADVPDDRTAPWWNFTEQISGQQSQAARALNGTMVLDPSLRVFNGAIYEYQHYDRVMHEGDGCRYYVYGGDGCPAGTVHGSTGHDAAGVMAAPASCTGAPGSATVARPYSVLGDEFRCGVKGALEQRNLMVPEGCTEYCSDHWPGIQTPSQCARICADTNECVSFDHSAETGRCYLGDGIAGVHAVLWTPPIGNYRYYERIPRGNPVMMSPDAAIGCRYGCTDWRAENHDSRAVQSSTAVGDASACWYRAEPALAAFHEGEQDHAFIPEDGRFLAQYRAAECEEMCAARCLAAGAACMAINYAAPLGQCYLLARVARSEDELTAVRRYVYRPRRMLTIPRPWGAPLPGLRTFNSLAERDWPAMNRTAVLGSLLRFDLPDRPNDGGVGDSGITSVTDIWRRMSNSSLADIGCELDEYSTAQVLAIAADTSAAPVMVHFPWRGAPQKVARAVTWSGSAGVGSRSAIVALDTVGMAHFVPRSKALCYLGMRVTINVTGGDASATAPSCGAAGGEQQGR